ncbi:MAG: phosphatidate cytidylyltransferase [Sphingomonadales bacterium]|nr:phosphatidate cytidylyltransferase [Sphingomonadales bacterium]
MADGNGAASGPARDLSALRDLGVRAASAVVMAAVAGAALWYGGIAWAALVVLVGVGVGYEWTKLVLAFSPSAAGRAVWLLVGLGYVGLAAMTLVALRNPLFGMRPIVSVIVTVIGIDVGAYLAGRVIGGPKIAPSISPSKTWAGLAGAILAATLLMVQFWRHEWAYALVGPVMAIVAQAGDFFESWMKRRAGVKDSGALIPGHGGLFDRVDGLLAVAFLMGVLRLVGMGVNAR